MPLFSSLPSYPSTTPLSSSPLEELYFTSVLHLLNPLLLLPPSLPPLPPIACVVFMDTIKPAQ